MGQRTTIWVVNSGEQEGEVDKVFAYRLTDDPATPENEYGAHDPDKDFDTLEPAAGANPTGIWSDGTTMWVVDRLDRKAYAYAMSDRSRLSDQDITLDADNALAAGAWGNIDAGDIDAGDIDAGEVGTLWVVDNQDRKLYAYAIRHTTPSLRSPDAKPTIIGTPKVGQTLTADTDRIGDLNGLPDDVAFRCQWQRVVDGRDIYINQALECTYTLPWRYVGLPIKVEVTFKDARGAFEIRRSDPTDPVARGPISNDFDLTIGGKVFLDLLWGVWGNDETIWVSKQSTATDNLLLAYNRSDGSRAAGKDIRLHVGENPHVNWAQYNQAPGASGPTVRRCSSSTSGTARSTPTTSLPAPTTPTKTSTWPATTTGPRVYGGNEETIWVANIDNRSSEYEKIFAYRRTDNPDTPENEYGSRDPDKDFNTLDAAGNQLPRGICSDGTTMWVVNAVFGGGASTRVFAYNMSDKSRRNSLEVQKIGSVQRGAWCEIGNSNRGTLWVVDRGTRKLHTYRITVEPPLQSALAQAELPETAPSAVQWLAYSVGDGGITLSWQRPEEDGGGDPVFYRVERSTDGSNYEEMETGTLETSCLDAAPPAEGGVFYRVSAYNAVGEGPWSGVALILGPPNTLATGLPTISGEARVGQTLTADTSGITDDEELDNAEFAYRWVRNDGNGDTDIPGATGGTYTLVEADEGRTIKVKVSFTDDASNPETLTSDPTGAVTPEAGPLAGFSLVADGTGDELLELVEGVQVVTGEYSATQFAIRANLEAGETVGSVRFELLRDGVNVTAGGGKTESYAPYSLYGDEGGQNLTGAALPEGDYRLTATAHSEKGAGGDKTGRLEVSFTVVETAPTPADTPAQEPPERRRPTLWPRACRPSAARSRWARR